MKGSADDHVETGLSQHHAAQGDEEKSSDHRQMQPSSTTEDQEHARSYVESTSSDGAEAIVRAAARTVRNLRAALVCVIIGAAASCGVLIYKLAAKNESDSFKYSFNGVATKMTESFTSVLFENLNYGYILSVALSSGIHADSDYTPSFPNVSIYQLDTLTSTVRLNGLISHLVWSPLLYTRDERKSWEAYAMIEIGKSQGQSSNASGVNPPCFVCGEGSEISNPNAQLSFPGVGTLSCEVVAVGAIDGYVTPEECSYYGPVIQNACGCQKITATSGNSTTIASQTAHEIFRLQDGKAVTDTGPPPYSPVWQVSPSLNGQKLIMFDQMSESGRRLALINMIDRKTPVVSTTIDPDRDGIYERDNSPTSGVFASLYFPVFASSSSEKLAGSLSFDFTWEKLFTTSLPPNADGLTIVVENSFGQIFTYKVAGDLVEYVGQGDHHDVAFDSMLVQSTYDDFNQLLLLAAPSQGYSQNTSEILTCSYRLRVYPSGAFQSIFVTSKPIIYTVIVVLAFGVASIVFFAYDVLVWRVQNKVVDAAKRSEDIVSSLFPALVKDRLLRYRNKKGSPSSSLVPSQSTGRNGLGFENRLQGHKARLRRYLTQASNQDMSNDESEPIADLYPNTTVLFADIAGFTAWSSEREPSQVFKLLESLYGEFDKLAKELGVFKVETIGDCYVAATGLPESMLDHAAVMVEFAFRCLVTMREMVSQLELVLGPGTADLSLRVGIHSGPVTAGVLRGERARFQLFGDTMNVASRMESTGLIDRVHISKETCTLLIKTGKEQWVTQRTELVSVKGKGQMQTYWANPLSFTSQIEKSVLEKPNNIGRLVEASNPVDDDKLGISETSRFDKATPDAARRNRLVDWNTDLLYGFLRNIVFKRHMIAKPRQISAPIINDVIGESVLQSVAEMTDVIEMPNFENSTVDASSSMELIGSEVRSQLRQYVAAISLLYRDNAFHNFGHACHVAMSASKLLKRITTPDDVINQFTSNDVSKKGHKATFGIGSDPLMQFVIVFSALVHDVDHTGVTNDQLVKENDPLAIQYDNKCVAEQRSIQVAWDTLMEDRFVELRRCIYQTEEEKCRFRQLLVNAVIATDIADRELGKWRKNRWEQVFGQDQTEIVSDATLSDHKAMIVFEYIIQASDVAHTMQHWHVYQKWNRRLFAERYAAYLAGREPEDPSIGWHQGEIQFFDNYVIPLAKKLEECNVFGTCYVEHLSYALQNRNEWEVNGEEIVRNMLSCHQRMKSDEEMPLELIDEDRHYCSDVKNRNLQDFGRDSL
jgi:class 3 adenylate cyclase